MTEKKCPLKFSTVTMDADGKVRENSCICEEDSCAWWTKWGCAVTDIATSFRDLLTVMIGNNLENPPA